MTFTPYLHFQGTCADAMEFYAGIFGAKDLTLMRYSEAPAEAGPITPSNRVMHAQLVLPGGAILMGSDFPDGVPGEPQAAVSISHAVPNVEAGAKLFDRLVKGGTPVMPFGPTFWSPGFGMLKDRFGTHWMLGVWTG